MPGQNKQPGAAQFRHNDYRRSIQVRAVADLPETESGKMIVEGKAVTFDEETILFTYEDVEYKEVIARGAFDDADMTQAFLKYNHTDSIMAMARTKNKTLQIDIRDDGVYIRAELANTSAGRDLYELVKRGDIDKMSFAFTIKEESFDAKEHRWTVRKIDKLYDVAAVTVPAYDSTDLYARRYDEAEANRRQEVEASALELDRAKIKARLAIAKK